LGQPLSASPIPGAEEGQCRKVFYAMTDEEKDALLVKWLFLFKETGWSTQVAPILELFNHGAITIE